MDTGFDESMTLLERIRTLEKQNKWMMRVGIAVGALLTVGVLVLNHAVHGEVTAQHFVLKDSNGRTRGELAMSPEGPALELYAASGEPRAEMVGGGQDASLNFYIPITTSQPRAASINFFMEKARMSSISADAKGTYLDLHSADGSATAQLSSQEGISLFELRGAGRGSPKIALKADSNHSCAMLSSAAQPEANESLCLDSDGLPAIKLADAAGNRATLGVGYKMDAQAKEPTETSAASLVLEQKDGKVLWSMPH